MALSKLSILQIGDVHFPEWQDAATDVDVKVSDFSPTIVSDLRIRPLTAVLCGIRDMCRSATIDAVITMGDYTSWGTVEAIEPALTALEGLINDLPCDRKIPVFGVPGNHDVSKEGAVKQGDTGKFAPLEAAFQRVGWRPPPVRTYARYEIAAPSEKKIPVVLLNSSIGSWSKSLYPEPLRAAIFDRETSAPGIHLAANQPFGDSAVASARPETIAAQVYDQLDTPYFRAVDINQIVHQIAADRRTTLIVSHHNLLPQHTPRVSYFGEVLNAGFARQALLSTKANILYLHGHIHDDPLEIVRLPDLDGGQLVSVSAPEIWKGFNKISLFFGEEENPFLAVVTPYRVDKFGKLVVPAPGPHRIPFISNSAELLKRSAYRLFTYLAHEVPAGEGPVFSWAEIVEHAAKAKVAPEEVESAILALYCGGLVKIHRFSEAHSTWRVEVDDGRIT